ncbi:MAG: hypothetical protein ABJD11_16905, partial [Gemmatimonadota bacterium]
MRLTFVVALGTFVPALLSAQSSGPAAPAPVIVPVPATATALPRQHKPEPTSAEISAKDLMTRLYIFSDDSMMGRE